MNLDEEERTLLISGNRRLLDESKRRIAEAVETGNLIAKSLHGDADKIRKLQETSSRLSGSMDHGRDLVHSIERRKYMEVGLICIVLTLVFGAVLYVLLIRRLVA